MNYSQICYTEEEGERFVPGKRKSFFSTYKYVYLFLRLQNHTVKLINVCVSITFFAFFLLKYKNENYKEKKVPNITRFKRKEKRTFTSL